MLPESETGISHYLCVFGLIAILCLLAIIGG